MFFFFPGMSKTMFNLFHNDNLKKKTVNVRDRIIYSCYNLSLTFFKPNPQKKKKKKL